MAPTGAKGVERMNRRGAPTALPGARIFAGDSAAGSVRLSFAPRPELCNSRQPT